MTDFPAPISTVGLFGNPEKAELVPAAQVILKQCRRFGSRVLASADLESALDQSIPCIPNPELVREADVVVALGGDGTMLRAARVLGLSGVPLLGVNLGSLGYLTDVPVQELREAMGTLLEGRCHLDRRSRVYGSVWRDGHRIASTNALNDLVVNMGSLPRALDMELALDEDSLGRFLGDGIVVSTPTGSTAYSLSAGGPICNPDVEGLIISPICPHSLGMRPLIVSKDTKIELILHETGEGAILTTDGQKAIELADGDRVVFREADNEVALVKFPQSHFYRVLRHKLNWGGTKRLGR